MAHRLTVTLGFLIAGAVCFAQDLPSVAKQQISAKDSPPAGIVKGIAYCVDTNQPARLAQVLLAQFSKEGSGVLTIGVTDLEGRFSAGTVPEGKYYIAAVLPGYVNPIAEMTRSRWTAMTPEARKDFEARLATVVVTGKHPAEVSLRLERAGEIDGTVLFDDGSPAISLYVYVKPKPQNKAEPDEGPSVPLLAPYEERLNRMTDDHGHFRVPGLAPGEYLVSITVPTASADRPAENPFVQAVNSSSLGGLVVYAGGGLRASKAKVFKVASGDAPVEADITIPLSSLHTIRGQVLLKSTGQPPPAAGVELLYADTRERARLSIAPDGEFEFSYVPEDSFILRAIASAEPLPRMEDGEDDGSGYFISGSHVFLSDSGKLKGGAEIPVLVNGDIAGVTISVPDAAAPSPAAAGATADTGDAPAVVPQ